MRASRGAGDDRKQTVLARGCECSSEWDPIHGERNSSLHPDNRKRMFIRVPLPNNEEGLFNADCSVALLLDILKKRHRIPQEDQIDLCSEEGALKHLSSHLSAASGAAFFELRELCLVVRVITSSGAEDGSSNNGTCSVTYVPVLEEYCNDEDFMAALNSTGDGKPSGEQGKGHKRSTNRSGGKPGTPDGGKGKAAASKTSHRRRGSFIK